MRLVALNFERALRTPRDWDDPHDSKLWRNNAHYFDDLNAVDAHLRSAWHAEYLRRWLAENPPTRGTGWDSYPVSLRIVNWIKWSLSGGALFEVALQSLAVQARWLQSRVEWHLLGNHLFVNAKALIFAGAYFDGAEADAWLRQGTEILHREIVEQVLPDGGQFERSPMYHALAMEDVLDLLNLAGAYEGQLSLALIEQLREAAPRMRRWSEVVSHPDGDIAFFNDAAIGIAPSQAELGTYAERLAVGRGSEIGRVEHLRDSGLVRVEHGPAVLFVDVGVVGPDYIPGHAHADTLSFELSLWSQRWLVNSGCSEYGVSAERLRQRGTAAHNTVVVDGANSSEVWSGFRVARRARPFGVRVEASATGTTIDGAHDGYRRLPGHVTHRRQWQVDDQGVLVTDWLEGGWATATGYLHLHPSVAVTPVSASRARLQRDNHSVTLDVEGGTLSLETSTWHPEFGRTLPSSRLVIAFDKRRVTTKIAFEA